MAFDVYQTVAPGLIGYRRRVTVMAITTVLFSLQIVLHAFWLERHDGLAWEMGGRRRAFTVFWRDPAFVPQGMRAYLRYYRPSFHPWRHDNRELIQDWQTQYTAASADGAACAG